jgi:hypothetical protein
VRVFNLTDQTLVYGGRSIAPYGSEEVAIDFIPNRDLALQKAGVLSFGSLPKGWSKPEPKPDPVRPVETPKAAPIEVPLLIEEPAPQEKLDNSFKKKK